ncbi:Membrane protein putative [Halorhabdus tiamatea SARL4B]|uniref:Drug/metabolite transporter (DMT) permease superfamily n=1 Tax=Halorhabdus tiamatea SARL4B TaxID=1033806 RepID=F7PLC5_9EURY|nr:DMT family transporter [Halorhabdus tiamatea]ERJ05175.1 Membrane protein putative [Halorhabdus tiamatea SARL4B]CCQ34714.1 drug/metabolite transporter (DMT) permease superfamily [Halorhabdus tiamatea SARL4B]
MTRSFVDRIERVPPLAGLAVAVFAVSTSAILIRWSSAPSIVVAFYRVLFTTLLLAPVVIWRERGSFRKLAWRDLAGAALAGIALAIHFAAWFESLAWTSVAASVTLVQAQPLFVAAAAPLVLDERVGPRTVAGIVVAVAGIAVMSAADLLGAGVLGPNPPYGNALALLGALAMAGYVLAGRSIRQRLPLLPYVTVVYTVAAVTLLGILGFQGAPLAGYPPREWLLFLGMAVGPGVFGHTVVNWALAHLESSVVSASLLGEPVGSTLLALVLLGEVPGVATALGGVVVLSGIVVVARARQQES